MDADLKASIQADLEQARERVAANKAAKEASNKAAPEALTRVRGNKLPCDLLHHDERKFMMSLVTQFNADASGEHLAAQSKAWVSRARSPERRALRSRALDLFQAAILEAERAARVFEAGCADRC